MNRVMSLVQSIRIRQILSVFFVGITFLTIQTFSYGNQFQAKAEPVTPEATSYQVEKTGDSLQTDVKNVKDKGNSIIDNVVEKLNLNEPLPESTKEFLGETEKKVDNTVEPITGKQGYYKEN